jgi:hypothetical protein
MIFLITIIIIRFDKYLTLNNNTIQNIIFHSLQVGVMGIYSDVIWSINNKIGNCLFDALNTFNICMC